MSGAMGISYQLVRRPGDVASPFAYAVVDGEGLPHLPLTEFGQALRDELAEGTARTYLNVVLPYFAYLDADAERRRRGNPWDCPPQAVRRAVRAYLTDRLGCAVEERDDHVLVTRTARSAPTVQPFLCAPSRVQPSPAAPGGTPPHDPPRRRLAG